MRMSKLCGLMAEKNISQAELAKQIGMSQNTLSCKLSGQSDFKSGEIKKVCAVIGINEPNDVVNIFFS